MMKYIRAKKYSETKLRCRRYSKLHCYQRLISGKDKSCVLFIMFGYILSFHWTHKQQHIQIVTLFTADVKGRFAELFSISAKQGHSQNIALIGCIMWTSTLHTADSSRLLNGGKRLGIKLKLKITKGPSLFLCV